MTINNSYHVEESHVDTALGYLGPPNFERFEPQGCIEQLVLLIKQVAICILRILNYICGDHQWHNNHTACQLIHQYISQCNTQSTTNQQLHAKICRLYNALLLRANGNASCAQEINLNQLQLQEARQEQIQEQNEVQTSTEIEPDHQGESNDLETDIHPLPLNELQSSPPENSQEQIQNQTSLPLMPEEAVPELEHHEEVSETQSGPSAAQVEINQHQRLVIDRILSKVLRLAEKSGDHRVDSLLEIVKVQRLIDANKALQTAEGIQFRSSYEEALCWIVAAQAQTNLEEAMTTANLIQHRMTREEADIEIAKVRALTNPEEAIATISRFQNSNSTDAAIYQMVKIQARTNPEAALENASLVWRYPYSTEKTYFQIAKIQASSNPEQALAIADRIRDVRLQVKTLCEIAKSQFADNPLQAAALVRRALEAANGDSSNRAEIFAIIVEAQALINPEEAVAAANLIQDPLWHMRALCMIAKEQASTNIPLTNELLAKALNKANLMGNCVNRDNILCEIALIQLSVNPEGRLEEMLDLSSLSASNLYKIIKIQALINPVQALATTNLIRYDNKVKAQALCAVANSPLITDPEQAKDILNQALDIARNTHERYKGYKAHKQCEMYCTILESLAKATR
jgi:hypothetical protein